MHVFKADGTAVCEEAAGDNVIEHDGTWSFKDNVLTLNYPGLLEESFDVLLLGGNTVLVVFHNKSHSHGCDIYYKKNATVVSPALADGRWDAPHNGVKPEVLTSAENDYTVSLIVKDGKLDMYVPAWGFHTTGTFAIENGILKYNVTNSWQGIWRDKDSYGWSASGPPYDDCKEYVDDGTPNMNPETFEIKAPWQTEKGDPMDNLRITQDVRLVVTPDGKEAYGIFANLRLWFYKR